MKSRIKKTQLKHLTVSEERRFRSAEGKGKAGMRYRP